MRLYWPTGVEQHIPALLHSSDLTDFISMCLCLVFFLTRQRALPTLRELHSHIIRSLYYSLRPFMHSPNPVSHWTTHSPLLCRQPRNVVPNSPAYIQPSVPPSCLPNPFNLALHPLCPVLSSPPERFIPFSLQTQDVHYLKWSRMNIKGGSSWIVLTAPPSPSRPPALSPQYFCLSIIRLQQPRDKERYELHQPCRWVLLPLP